MVVLASDEKRPKVLNFHIQDAKKGAAGKEIK